MRVATIAVCLWALAIPCLAQTPTHTPTPLPAGTCCQYGNDPFFTCGPPSQAGICGQGGQAVLGASCQSSGLCQVGTPTPGFQLPAQGDCTFPNPPDILSRAQPRDVVLPVINRLNCVVNRLQNRALQTQPNESICEDVTIEPASQVAVLLTASRAFVGDETVLVQARDDSEPPRLVADSETHQGMTVTVAVMNHDADATRSGRVCANIVRP